jgi:Mlc titration factor MtfA (ptsG expression regulator)
MFGLLRNRRRRQILATAGISNELWTAAIAASPVLARLDSDSQRRLRDLTLLFLHEKRFEAAGGLLLDDSMRIRIAALACLPILELGIDSYEGFVSVIVYPDEFLVRDREYVDDDGVVHSSDDVLSGEAWEQGPVILAWKEVEASGHGDGFNVVAHEFAHKLDLLDGSFDGMPPLHAGMRATDWIEAFQSAYEDLQARLERGEETWLDPYAAEEPAEFFAVCTEMFFDVPEEFRAEYPALYAQLSAFYKQDPAHVA